MPDWVNGGDLGIAAEDMARHIAWDVGALGVARALGQRLGAPVVWSDFSRLVIDPNRGEDDPTLLMRLYDGTVIKANYPMSRQERERRLNEYYRPYHDAVSATIASVAKATGTSPFIFSLHSFTPVMQGRARPWHAGVLWDLDDRAPLPLIEMLARDPSIVVGDNEPYDLSLIHI